MLLSSTGGFSKTDQHGYKRSETPLAGMNRRGSHAPEDAQHVETGDTFKRGDVGGVYELATLAHRAFPAGLRDVYCSPAEALPR